MVPFEIQEKNTYRPKFRLLFLYRKFLKNPGTPFGLIQLSSEFGTSKPRILEYIHYIHRVMQDLKEGKLIGLKDSRGRHHYQFDPQPGTNIQLEMDQASFRNLVTMNAMCRGFFPETLRQEAGTRFQKIHGKERLGKANNYSQESKILEVKLFGWVDYEPFRDTISQLQDGVWEKKTLEVQYRQISKKWGGRKKTLTLFPLGFLFYRGGLYLRACSLKAKKIPVCFIIAVHRIEKVKPILSPNPEIEIQEKKPVTGYFGLEVHPPLKVTIQFEAKHATFIEERQWSRFEKKRKRGNHLLLTLHTTNMVELKAWVASFENGAKIIQEESQEG